MPEQREKTVVAPLTAEVIRVATFRAALRRFLHRSEVAARAVGLTPRWYLLLVLVKGAYDGSERVTVGELAEQMQLAASSATELIQRAEAAGLVARGTSPDDARSVSVRLTPEGERRLAQAFVDLADERRALAEALLPLLGLVEPPETARRQVFQPRAR